MYIGVRAHSHVGCQVLVWYSRSEPRPEHEYLVFLQADCHSDMDSNEHLVNVHGIFAIHFEKNRNK